MNTLNLGLVFGNAEHVYIIVCASEEPIDDKNVDFVATKYFKAAMNCFNNIDRVIEEMTKGINKECGCNAVIVRADSAVHIPRR